MKNLMLVVGAVLAVGGLALAGVVTRPRPRTVRDVVYLVGPVVGMLWLVVAAWAGR